MFVLTIFIFVLMFVIMFIGVCYLCSDLKHDDVHEEVTGHI